jgi:hypothetical protein
MKRNSGIIGNKKEPTRFDGSSGVFDLYDQYIEKRNNTWPNTFKYLSCTESTSTVSEGNTVTFTVTTEALPAESLLYYTISTVSGTTMDAADFDGTAISNSFSHNDNSTVLSFTLTAEYPGDVESNSFKLQIRTGSTSGTIQVESGTVTVTDVAGMLGTDIRTAFYEISNRAIVDTTSADYTGNWDVGEVQQQYAGSARIYIATKITALTTFNNDICLAAVQILNSSDVVQQTWNFADGGAEAFTAQWQTKTATVLGSADLLSTYLTPAQAQTSFGAGYAFISATGFNTYNRISRATSTGTGYTGMADGVATGLTSFPVGDSTVAQSSGTYYLYREASSSTRYQHCLCRSPLHTFSAGDKIRVCHAVTIPGTESGNINIDDSIWIGIY